MKIKIILLGMILFASICTISAAKKKKKKVKSKPAAAQVVPVKNQPNTMSTLTLCNNDYNFPYWRLALVKGFQFPKDMQVPSQFRLVTINEKALNDYLQTVPYEKNGTKKIQLPIYKNGLIACKEYLIERVPTMDSALQAKYPQIMSFRAFDPNNQLNTARVDCDGTQTSVLIRDENETYFINPVIFNKTIYYACYSKNDPNFQKKDFEMKNNR